MLLTTLELNLSFNRIYITLLKCLLSKDQKIQINYAVLNLGIGFSNGQNQDDLIRIVLNKLPHVNKKLTKLREKY